MEEKTIIKSEKLSGAVFLSVGAIIGFLVTIITGYYCFIGHWNWFGKGSNGVAEFYAICLGLGLFAVFFVVYLGIKKCELTVTDKRVYGTAAFGKRVDLPFDMISAVGTSFLNGIAVTTASGAIKFLLIKNKDKIHSELSKLLIDRQSKPTANTTIKQEIPQSNAEELKKYKDLLDSGTITQDEFDAKKKQLLGL